MTSYTYLQLDSMTYPLFQGDIRLRNPQIGETFFVPEGYVEVQRAEIPDLPQGHYIVELPPELINDVWTQVFTTAAFTQEALDNQEQQRQELKAQRSQNSGQNINQPGSEPDVIG